MTCPRANNGKSASVYQLFASDQTRLRGLWSASESAIYQQLSKKGHQLSAGRKSEDLGFNRGSRALIGFLDLFLDLSPDLRVFEFTAALAIVTSLLFGLAPALLATRLGPNDALKEGAHGMTGRRGRWRHRT